MSTPPVELTLERFFRPLLVAAPGPTRILAAFSGGPDSTALLAGLVAVAPCLGLEVHAAHLDHALDDDSRRRAREARRLAAELGVDLAVARLGKTTRPDGLEAAARHARYAFLERRATEIGAHFIATAHHADDQAETVLLRLLFGSGVAGLAGIRARQGRVVRPFLGLRRHQLRDHLVASRLRPVADPTNADLAAARNRVRHLLLPRLGRESPDVVSRLCRLASSSAAAGRRVDALLAARLAPRPVPGEPGVWVERSAIEALPEALLPHALALLHRRAGVLYPAAARARTELVRQLLANHGGRVGCDCGGGWRWEAASGILQLVRRETPAVEFAYTLESPGEVEIPEIGLRFRLRRGRVAPWMFTSCPDRAGLAPPPGRRRVEIRNRRPGDRLLPLGSDHHRRLKDLLIDRQVPRRLRNRLPLLVVDGEIAWVPGVTVGESFRLDSAGKNRRAWVAEVTELDGNGEPGRCVANGGGSRYPTTRRDNPSPVPPVSEQERLEP